MSKVGWVASHRDYSLDVLRVLACLMVVLMHSPYPSNNASGMLCRGIYYYTSPCIGIFFMISGALLLPCKDSMMPFLKKRLGKIVAPTLVWSIIYISLGYIVGDAEVFRKLLSIPFSPIATGAIWFMYTLVGIYIVAPIVSQWLINCSQFELKFVLGLWVITLVYKILDQYLIVREDIEGTLYYFSGYLGYFISGYALKDRRIYIRKNVGIPLFIVSILVVPLDKVFNLNLSNEALWYLGPFTAFMSILIFQLIALRFVDVINSYISKKELVKEFIKSFSRYSFGIYLVHIAIMRFFLWNMAWFINISNYILQILISFSLTVIFSYVLVWLIGRFKYSKYIIAA